MTMTRDHVEGVLAEADELLTDIVNRHTSPGLAVGVVHDGELVYGRGFGFADVDTKRPVATDTVFRIGSTSKTLTGIGLMQLWEQGRFDLDDPVVEHLRSYPFEQPVGTRAVTIRDMFTHTSGVGEVRSLADLRLRGTGLAAPEGEPIPSLGEWYAKGLRAEVGPGEKWAYANHAIATLGQLIEDLSGQPFEEYMIEHVLEPLGMLGSDFLRSQRVRDRLAVGYKRKRGRFEPVRYLDIVVAAAGSMFSSIDDMALYLTALMSGGSNEHGSVLKPDTLGLMYESHWEMDPRLFSMGLMFMREDLYGHRVVHHGGGWPGFKTMLRVAPDDRLGIIAFTNGDALSSWEAADSLLRRLLDVPQVGEDLPRPGILERPDLWPDLVGVYKPPPGLATNARMIGSFGNEIEILVQDGHLHARSVVGSLRRPVRLHPIDPEDPLLLAAVSPHGQHQQTAKFLFEVGSDGRAVALRGEDASPFQLQRVAPVRSARRLAAGAAGLAAAGALAAGVRAWRSSD